MEQNTKGQIFFFGRPDSLKHCIPIRTNNEEKAKTSEESISTIKNDLNNTANDKDNGIETAVAEANEPDTSSSTENNTNESNLEISSENLQHDPEETIHSVENNIDVSLDEQQSDNISSALLTPTTLIDNQNENNDNINTTADNDVSMNNVECEENKICTDDIPSNQNDSEFKSTSKEIEIELNEDINIQTLPQKCCDMDESNDIVQSDEIEKAEETIIKDFESSQHLENEQSTMSNDESEIISIAANEQHDVEIKETVPEITEKDETSPKCVQSEISKSPENIDYKEESECLNILEQQDVSSTSIEIETLKTPENVDSLFQSKSEDSLNEIETPKSPDDVKNTINDAVTDDLLSKEDDDENLPKDDTHEENIILTKPQKNLNENEQLMDESSTTKDQDVSISNENEMEKSDENESSLKEEIKAEIPTEQDKCSTPSSDEGKEEDETSNIQNNIETFTENEEVVISNPLSESAHLESNLIQMNPNVSLEQEQSLPPNSQEEEETPDNQNEIKPVSEEVTSIPISEPPQIEPKMLESEVKTASIEIETLTDEPKSIASLSNEDEIESFTNEVTDENDKESTSNIDIFQEEISDKQEPLVCVEEDSIENVDIQIQVQKEKEKDLENSASCEITESQEIINCEDEKATEENVDEISKIDKSQSKDIIVNSQEENNQNTIVGYNDQSSKDDKSQPDTIIENQFSCNKKHDADDVNESEIGSTETTEAKNEEKINIDLKENSKTEEAQEPHEIPHTDNTQSSEQIDQIKENEISTIEIQKGVELNETKVEDVSVAEEAKDEVLLDKMTSLEKTPTELLAKEEPVSLEVKKEEEPAVTKNRKRKFSDKKISSESDSDDDSHFVTDSVSHDQESEVEEEEEVVQAKKPRIRGKVSVPKKKMPTRRSARAEGAKVVATSSLLSITPAENEKEDKQKEVEIQESKEEQKTLQNIKFDYDENEDVVANIAAIKTLICKEPVNEPETRSSDEEDASEKKYPRRGRKGKRGRAIAANKAQIQATSGSEDDSKSSKMPDSKRSKTSESNEPSEASTTEAPKKKRERNRRGLLKDIDTSLVIETVESEAPIRQSRRIAQQKIREESERREMEEKMLKQMKENAEKKKVGPPSETVEGRKDSDSDESYKGGSRKKKKKKLKPSDKPWQTSSSHSEHTETDPDDYYHHHSEDAGSPLFRSDHEFSPESDNEDDTTPAQPLKRARTAKKQVEESSDEEDVNPNHACQACHKTDSPEWILLCDECDCGYHCSCLKPIIFCIPSGNWYCPLCCHKKLIVNLSEKLEQLDNLVSEIEAEELKKQKQIEARKLTEITEENILKERRKNRKERRNENNQNVSEDSSNSESGSNSNDEGDDDNKSGNSSDDSSDNEPLTYKLRKRNQTTASYRFNDYDELINSAIRDEMEEVKGLGNAGRGKDISTIIEADKEEKKQQRLEKERIEGGGVGGGKKIGSEKDEASEAGENDDASESSNSEIVKTKKMIQKKKKNRKLNNLDETSEEDKASDEDFKDSSSSNSDTEEEDYSASSISESSLDLPLKKNKNNKRNTRSSNRNRQNDRRFINDESSDDEPLIKKRSKKQVDSDEDDFDINEENDSEDSIAEQIDSEDLCDDTDTESSESNWPRKKKRAIASYDKKPRKPVKKYDEDDNKAFRAGISKKKIIKKNKSDNEENNSKDSGSDTVTGRRKTRGKKLLYLLEDDYESDDDGIKPGIGVVRPETPPEEREMFRKKQEEIKKMLAAKNTEAARQLAVPTIEPLNINLEAPKSPTPPPPLGEGSSLSTIPKNVIEGAKALDMDYNRIKPIHFGSTSSKTGSNIALGNQQEMSEEELAKMMEEEDFAQHQLKLAGEAIARNRVLELEVKEEAFATFGKAGIGGVKEKPVTAETKKRARKSKTDKNGATDVGSEASKKHPELQNSPNKPHQLPIPPQGVNPIISSAPPPLISNAPPHNPSIHNPYINQSVRYPPPPSVHPHNLPQHPNRPPLLGNIPPSESPLHSSQLLQQQLRFPHQAPPENFMPKVPGMTQIHQQPLSSQPQIVTEDDEKSKKAGRRKKFTPLRQDLPESNISKVAKLDPIPSSAATSVIHSTPNLAPSERNVDDKNRGFVPGQRPLKSSIDVASPPQIFNPATNPTPSVITRLIQQQIPPTQHRIGFNERDSAPSAQTPPSSNRGYPSTDEIKHLAAVAASKQPRSSSQASFSENPFVPRTMHHSLYRPPSTSQSIYGIPPHARLPYPFHLTPHPNNNNLRANMPEFASNPYALPPQFGYYAHGRPQLPSNTGIPHGISHLPHPDNIHHGPPHARNDDSTQPNANDPQQQSTSEFGGLVSYFSSQQELD